MKKLLLVLIVLMALCACEVRHDHSKRMPQARVALDTAQKNDVADTEAKEYFADEDLIVIPEEIKRGNAAGVEDEIEKIMKGEDVSSPIED
jgi:hypothetical protein